MLWRYISRCDNPQALYVSVSTFLQPHKNHGNFRKQKAIKGDRYFYPRHGYITADCILLDTYFFVDIDCEKDIRLAQKEARRVIDKLRHNIKLKLHSIQFSGTKGFHLIYEMKKRKIKNPTKRIQYYQNQKEQFAKDIAKLNLKSIDKNHISIMKDMFRVYAAPYSRKPNGRIVKPIKLKDFMNKSYSIGLPPVDDKKISEAKADDQEEASCEGKPSSQPYCKRERAGLSSLCTFLYVDNMVTGLKDNYVTVIKKHKSRFKLKMLKYLQETYNLSEFSVFQVGNYVFAINTKCSQFERVVKIMRAAKSENLNYFISRRHYPIPVSAIYSKNCIMNIRKMGRLNSNKGKDHDHSIGHSKLFGLNYDNMVGRANSVYGMMYKAQQGEII